MKKTYKIILTIAVILILFILFYNVYNLFNPGVKTQIVSKGTIEEIVKTEGVVIRDEEIVLKSSDVIVSSVVLDGERVYKGQKLADLYEGQVHPEIQAELREVNEKISDLERLMGTASGGTTNTADGMIKEYSRKIVQYSHLANGESLYKIRGKIDDVMNRKIASNSKNADATISGLKTRQKELEAQIVGEKKEVYAGIAGMYFSTFDGFEGKINSDKIEELTPHELTEIQKNTPDKNERDSTMKVVDGFSWYIAVNVDEGKLPSLKKKQQLGSDVGLRFPIFGQDSYPSQIVHISEPEDGKVLVVFKSYAYCDAVYYNRFLDVDIILSTQTGLKFFKDAIKVVNEKTGVYIMKTDGVARFRNVNILATDDGYVVVKEETSEENSNRLLLYDEVIVTRNEISDGEIVR